MLPQEQLAEFPGITSWAFVPLVVIEFKEFMAPPRKRTWLFDSERTYLCVRKSLS